MDIFIQLMKLTEELLRNRFDCDIAKLRAERDEYYPDSLELRGRFYPLQYEYQLATVTLSANCVKSLPYDMLVLPGGDPIKVEMLVPIPGSKEKRRVVSTTVADIWSASMSYRSYVFAFNDLVQP